jgi:hypothetical protein
MLSHVTNSMEQSHNWEANSRSSAQDIFTIVRNPKVHSRIYKSHSLVLYPESIISHTLSLIHVLILCSRLMQFSQVTFSFLFLNKYFYTFFIFSMPATCPTHLILLDLTILIISDEEFELCNFSSRTLSQPPSLRTLFETPSIYEYVLPVV